MIHIALLHPEIPPNTGNIIRLCANTGAQLHVIHPLGFSMDDKRMRRAGLDYHEYARVMHYADDTTFFKQHSQRRIFACTTKTNICYTGPIYQAEDLFLFGAETTGLPEEIRQRYLPIRIPMLANSRSINLANAVAIILYEAWRQLGFTAPGN